MSTAEALRDKEISGLTERETAAAKSFVRLNSYFKCNNHRCLLYSLEKEKTLIALPNFLRNSITHQCLLFLCSGRGPAGPTVSTPLESYFQEKLGGTWTHLAPALFVQQVNQWKCNLGQGLVRQGLVVGAWKGRGAKKGGDQACNDRPTQKNPCTTHSLRGEHLQKNQQWTSLGTSNSFAYVTRGR